MSILLNNSLLLTDKLANAQVDMISIFPKGHVTLVAGEPGIGKTWFMLSVCKSLAEGSRGLGSATELYPKGKALVFAGETGVRLLASRVYLMGGIKPLDSVRVISSHVCANMNIDTMINTAIGRKNIEEAVSEFRPDMVFFDTMISFMADGKDESSQVDMTDCIRGLGAIASRYNAAVVIMHHFRKRTSLKSIGEERHMDEVIGTSAFIRLASLVIGIERKDDVRTVRCLKSWWEEFAPFTFKIKEDDKGVIRLVQDYNYCSDGTYSVTRTSRALESTILARYVDCVFTAMDVACDYDVSRTTASEAITSLCRKNLVHSEGKSGYTKLYALGPKEEEVSNDDSQDTTSQSS